MHFIFQIKYGQHGLKTHFFIKDFSGKAKDTQDINCIFKRNVIIENYLKERPLLI